MEVIAAGARVMVASAATAAVIVGAIGGAIVWRGGNRLTLGGLSAVAVYFLAATDFLGFSFLTLHPQPCAGAPVARSLSAVR